MKKGNVFTRALTLTLAGCMLLTGCGGGGEKGGHPVGEAKRRGRKPSRRQWIPTAERWREISTRKDSRS